MPRPVDIDEESKEEMTEDSIGTASLREEHARLREELRLALGELERLAKDDKNHDGEGTGKGKRKASGWWVRRRMGKNGKMRRSRAGGTTTSWLTQNDHVHVQDEDFLPKDKDSTRRSDMTKDDRTTLNTNHGKCLWQQQL